MWLSRLVEREGLPFPRTEDPHVPLHEAMFRAGKKAGLTRPQQSIYHADAVGQELRRSESTNTALRVVVARGEIILQRAFIDKVGIPRPDQKAIPRSGRNAVSPGRNGHYGPERTGAQSPAGQECNRFPMFLSPSVIEVDRLAWPGYYTNVPLENERGRGENGRADADCKVGITTTRRNSTKSAMGMMEASKRHADLKAFSFAAYVNEGATTPGRAGDHIRLLGITIIGIPAMHRIPGPKEDEAVAPFNEVHVEYEPMLCGRVGVFPRIAKYGDSCSRICFTTQSTNHPPENALHPLLTQMAKIRISVGFIIGTQASKMQKLLRIPEEHAS